LESLSRYAWQPHQTTEFAMDINPARDDPEPDLTLPEGSKP
jgi:multicomponent K+:H+ antiporter subunit A